MIIEFLKHKLNHNLQCDFYFYRDTNKKEIDLIVDYSNVISLIEIKKKEILKKHDWENLHLNEVQFANAKKYILSFNRSIKKVTSDIDSLYWSDFCKVFKYE